MFKKLFFIALTAACFTACDFLNKKTQASGGATTTTESLPPSITDTVGSIAQNDATKAVSDKEIAAAKQKMSDEAAATAASAKKGSAKKAANESLLSKAKLARVKPVLRRNDLRCIQMNFSVTIYKRNRKCI